MAAEAISVSFENAAVASPMIPPAANIDFRLPSLPPISVSRIPPPPDFPPAPLRSSPLAVCFSSAMRCCTSRSFSAYFCHASGSSSLEVLSSARCRFFASFRSCCMDMLFTPSCLLISWSFSFSLAMACVVSLIALVAALYSLLDSPRAAFTAACCLRSSFSRSSRSLMTLELFWISCWSWDDSAVRMKLMVSSPSLPFAMSIVF